MKKSLFIIIFMIFVLSLSSIAFAKAKPKDIYIKVIVNGQVVDFPDGKPIMDKNNRVMVPIRLISEKLDATVDWNSQNQMATIKREDTTIKLKINERVITVNGKRKEMDTEAKLLNGRTYVPLRFVSENMGITVNWNNDTKTADIWGKKKQDNYFMENVLGYVYKDDTYNFSLEFPKNWEGKYSVNQEDNGISVCNKANEKADKGGVIFWIKTYSVDDWDSGKVNVKTSTQNIELGRDSFDVFVLLYATDVQYDINNKELSQEYITMCQDIGLIAKSFKLN